MRLDPDQWQPIGVGELEPNAEKVVRASDHSCVTAGPGAGKTELLAQKASFLLQTVLCPPPYRILAISFKKDAADNLAERVALRCSVQDSGRLDSITFDAFTKNLVDRFRLAIPSVWRPPANFEPEQSTRAEFRKFISNLIHFRPHWRAELQQLTLEKFEQESLGSMRLPVTPSRAESALESAILNWAKRSVDRDKIPFVVINRLAELLVRASPDVHSALLATYPYVFIDEFQDTTFSQYDFLASAFHGQSTRITAVGDNKQRIMIWAGAKPDAFSAMAAALEVAPIDLQFNYRSSAELVRLQQIVAKAIDVGSSHVASKAPISSETNSAVIWRSDQVGAECEKIARWIREDRSQRGCSLAEYAILVRQKANDFEEDLKPYFEKYGLKLVNHSRYAASVTLQDLLKEQLVRLNLLMLRLASADESAQAWTTVRETLHYLHQVDPEENEQASLQLESKLQTDIDGLKALLLESSTDNSDSHLAVSEYLAATVPDILWSSGHREYQDSMNLNRIRESFAERLAQVAVSGATWVEVLQDFGGEDAVPIMTLHKSKGLEFDTVFSIGLDDTSWWSYPRDTREGLATFFVGLSRAKRKVIFAHCGARGRRDGIADLFGLLAEGGVPEEDD